MAGKHHKEGTPRTGNGVKGGKKPSLLDIVIKWPTGATMPRQTVKFRRQAGWGINKRG